MNISNRLKTIASFVSSDAYIIDVGCDHALLDIYLCLNNDKIKAIASDINEKPLKQAKKNIEEYKLEKRIKIQQQNGIENIDSKIDTIVISGMGTSTIIDILFTDINKLKNINKIIISSNNDYYKLRKTFIKYGYFISKEDIVYENNKYYPIIVFEKGKIKYNYFELKYGPLLLKNKSNVFINYIKNINNKNVVILKEIPKKYIFKRLILKKEIRYLNKII